MATVGLASDPADPAALAGCISQPGPWRMGPRLPPGGQGQTKGSRARRKCARGCGQRGSVRATGELGRPRGHAAARPRRPRSSLHCQPSPSPPLPPKATQAGAACPSARPWAPVSMRKPTDLESEVRVLQDCWGGAPQTGVGGPDHQAHSRALPGRAPADAPSPPRSARGQQSRTPPSSRGARLSRPLARVPWALDLWQQNPDPHLGFPQVSPFCEDTRHLRSGSTLTTCAHPIIPLSKQGDRLRSCGLGAAAPALRGGTVQPVGQGRASRSRRRCGLHTLEQET